MTAETKDGGGIVPTVGKSSKRGNGTLVFSEASDCQIEAFSDDVTSLEALFVEYRETQCRIAELTRELFKLEGTATNGGRGTLHEPKLPYLP